MRAAVLELAFAGLGAQRARSGFIEGNAASATGLAKARLRTGRRSDVGTPRRPCSASLELVLHRAQWTRNRTTPVAIDGLEPCLPLFGVRGRSGMKAE